MARPTATVPTITPYLRGNSLSLVLTFRGVKYQTPVIIKDVAASQQAKNGYLNTTRPDYIEANELLAAATTHLTNAIALIPLSELTTASIRTNYLRLQTDALEAKEIAIKKEARKRRMIEDVRHIDTEYSLEAIEEEIADLEAQLTVKRKERDDIKKFLNLYVEDNFVKLLEDYSFNRNSNLSKSTKRHIASFIETVKQFDSEAKINEVGEQWLTRFQDWLLVTPARKPIYRSKTADGKRGKGEFLRFEYYEPRKNSTVETYINQSKAALRYYEARPDLLPSETKVNLTYKLFNFELTAKEDNVQTFEEVELFNLFQLNKIWGRRETQKEKAIDILLFLCSTSLRFSDLSKVIPQTIKDNRIMLTAKKTKKHNIKVNIPLNPISSAILVKYSNDMRNCTMAYENVNKYIRQTLNENADIFPTLQELEPISRPSGKDNDNTQYIKRAELIGTHSGRRTYVNICLDYNVPINKIMGATGHTNVNTLMIYANKRKDVNKYMANTFQFNPTEKEVYQIPESLEITEAVEVK